MTYRIFNSLLVIAMTAITQSALAGDLPRIGKPPAGVEIPAGFTSPEPTRGYRETHNSIESDKLRISIDGGLNGFVEGKVCDFCKEITVTITPDTRAFDNNREVPLARAKDRLGRYATVIYELETKKVTQIRW